ncbi:hypothetical protein SU86_000470 [Candidatus Nitrosotenuis cloacae]|uniref:EamA domain-containing protein n=1 Tax=Candidatus Nitrosotenuis cloacae TaxID=1603555 RepID=A0A3G1B8F4_9ARCH|nr:hypothetical protein SU86_000470 [Candidatus Nitrosotenuis cloacae]
MFAILGTKKLILGYVAAIASAILASLTHSISKPLLIDGTTGADIISPIVLAGIVYIVAGLFFTPLKKNDTIQSIGKKNIFLMVLIGVAEISAMIVSFSGIKETTAVNASIFINSEIVFSMMIAIIIFRERLQTKEVPPFLLIVLGAAIIPLVYDLYSHNMVFSSLVLGDMLIILGGFFFAAGNMIAKHVSDNVDVKRITQISSLSAGIFGIALSMGLQAPFDITLDQIPAILLIGVLDVGFAAMFFVIALKLIGSIKTILLFSTASVFGMIFAHLLLNEAITIFNVLSIGVVFLGLYWLRNKIAKSEETLTT